MKLSHVLGSLLALTGTTLAATSLNDLPVCAQQAGLSAISATGCSFTDLTCICTSVPFLQTLRAYIAAHCSASDTSAALAFGQDTCGNIGVPIATSVGATALNLAGGATTATATAVQGTATSTVQTTGVPVSVTVPVTQATAAAAETGGSETGSVLAGTSAVSTSGMANGTGTVNWGVPAATYTGAAHRTACGVTLVLFGALAGVMAGVMAGV